MSVVKVAVVVVFAVNFRGHCKAVVVIVAVVNCVVADCGLLAHLSYAFAR